MKNPARMAGLICVVFGMAAAVAASSPAGEDKSQQDRMRTLAGMTPITNHVPLPSSSLGNGSSATWFLDPNKSRVITCSGNPTAGVRCASAEIPSQ